METNLFYLIVSFLYIFFVVLFAFILKTLTKVRGETVRKIIHILTSCWIFIMLYGMDNPYYMILGPLLFIFINGFFVYFNLGKYLGMDDRKRNNGLIYYPLSILILILFYVSDFLSSNSVIAGVLAMGFGDGFAALVGSKWGKNSFIIFKQKKSIEGSFTMFLVTFLTTLFFAQQTIFVSLLSSVLATSLEIITPLGFDNITVPILTSFLVEVL